MSNQPAPNPPKEEPQESCLGCLFALIAIIFIIAIIFHINKDVRYISEEEKEKQRYDEMISKIPIADEKTISVTFNEFYSEYKNNFVAANQKYKNKWIILTGNLKYIRQSLDNKPELGFDGNNKKKYFPIYIDKKREKPIAALKLNNSASIYCQVPDNFSINDFIDNIELKNCFVCRNTGKNIVDCTPR